MSDEVDPPPDSPEPTGNVLLLAPSHSGDERDLCADLMAGSPPERTNVLFVTVTQSPRDRLDVWRERFDESPASCGIVSVESGGSDGGSPTGRRPNTKTVSRPGDLTGVNIAMTEFLSAWSDDDNRTVVCFHSLTPLLQYADPERVFKFVNELTSVLARVGATAHFHMDPGAHDAQVCQTIKSLFDTVVDCTETDAQGDGVAGPGPVAVDDASAGGDEAGDASAGGDEAGDDSKPGGTGSVAPATPRGSDRRPTDGDDSDAEEASAEGFPRSAAAVPYGWALIETVRSNRTLSIVAVAVVGVLVLGSLGAATVPAALGFGNGMGEGSLFGGFGVGTGDSVPQTAGDGNGTSTPTPATTPTSGGHPIRTTTPASVPTPTSTSTPSSTLTSTPTSTSTSTSTQTSASTSTQTPTPTPAPTPTPTSSDDGIIGTLTGDDDDDGLLGL